MCLMSDGNIVRGAVVLGKENEAGGKASVMRPFVHEVPWSATIQCYQGSFQKRQ